MKLKNRESRKLEPVLCWILSIRVGLVTYMILNSGWLYLAVPKIMKTSSVAENPICKNLSRPRHVIRARHVVRVRYVIRVDQLTKWNSRMISKNERLVLLKFPILSIRVGLVTKFGQHIDERIKRNIVFAVKPDLINSGRSRHVYDSEFGSALSHSTENRRPCFLLKNLFFMNSGRPRHLIWVDQLTKWNWWNRKLEPCSCWKSRIYQFGSASSRNSGRPTHKKKLQNEIKKRKARFCWKSRF